MRTLNPLSKNNIIHDMAMFCLVLWLTVNYAYENYIGHTIYASLSLYLFLGIGAFWLLVKGSYTITRNYFFVSMILLLVLILFSFFYIPESISALASRWSYRYFTNIVLVFIIINLVRDDKDMEFVFKGFVAGGLLLAFLFYQFYGSDVFEVAEMAEDPNSRLGWQFGNVNLLAQKCTFSVIIAFYYTQYAKSKFNRAICAFIAVFVFSVCLFSGSKKAIFVVAFSVIYLILSKSVMRRGGSKMRAFISIAIIVVLMIVVIYNVPYFDIIRQRLDSFFSIFTGKQVSVSDMRRISYIRRGLSQFLQKPFFGNGVNYSEYMFGTYSHNNYVEMLLNFGIVGFIIYYYPYFAGIKRTVMYKDTKGRRKRALFLSIMIGILITDIGVVTYYDRNIAILMCLVSKYYSDLPYEQVESNERGK